MNVLSLCDFTGNMVQPWAEAGHDCVCVDIAHPISGPHTKDRITCEWGDVRSYVPSVRPDIIFAFPPCTNLAVSGARWFKKKGLRALIDALELVEACRVLCEVRDVPWMIENPVSRLSTLWRAPDHIFDPCDYGDPYTKKTCLWVGGGFKMPPKKSVPPTSGSKMHLLPPSANRAALRSETPKGFARAVYEANS